MVIRCPYFTCIKLLNQSSWFANIKSMHVGFIDWKHVGDEMRLFMLKRLSNSSKCLFYNCLVVVALIQWICGQFRWYLFVFKLNVIPKHCLVQNFTWSVLLKVNMVLLSHHLEKTAILIKFLYQRFTKGPTIFFFKNRPKFNNNGKTVNTSDFIST